MIADDALGKREAEAGAVRACSTAAIELSLHVQDFTGGNAIAMIGDGDRDGASCRRAEISSHLCAPE